MLSANLCGYIARHKFSFHLKIRDAKSEKVWLRTEAHCRNVRMWATRFVGGKKSQMSTKYVVRSNIAPIFGRAINCSSFRKKAATRVLILDAGSFLYCGNAPRVIVVEVEKAKVCLTLRKCAGRISNVTQYRISRSRFDKMISNCS